jgi:ACS family hexuronate transporter-like MFS transporter
MRVLLTDQIDSWRFAFQVVGAIGLLWVPFWLWLVKSSDLSVRVNVAASAAWHDLFTRRMVVVLIVVALINTTWQVFRAWLPKFLIEGRGYIEAHALYFNSAFFVASDIGCIGAGALALWLAKRGMDVHRSRMSVFLACAVIAAAGLFIPVLPKGWLLLAVLLLVAAGSLGVFPIYHAFTQDISAHHQGKVTGIAGVAAWGFSPPAQKFFGRIVDKTGSFDAGMAIAGCLPLIAFVVLLLFWNKRESDPGLQG